MSSWLGDPCVTDATGITTSQQAKKKKAQTLMCVGKQISRFPFYISLPLFSPAVVV